MDYMVFVLGYDLMQKALDKAEMACDEAFKFCKDTYEEFLKSDFASLKVSEYDAMRMFLEENYALGN